MTEPAYNDTPAQMSSMASMVSGYKLPKKVKGMGARQELICQICNEVGITDNQLQSVFFQAKSLTDAELKHIRDKAVSFKANPPALFWKLLKEKRKEIQVQLK